MYKSFEIENFRCFRHLRMDDLARVNLIVGKNNVGKTALLEALHIHDSAPDTRAISEALRNRHGEPLEGVLTAERPEPLNELVWRFDTANVVELSSRNEKQQEKTVRFEVRKNGTPLDSPQLRMNRERLELRKTLVMKTSSIDGGESDSDLLYDGSRFRQSKDVYEEFMSRFIDNRQVLSEYADVIRFSKLQEEGHTNQFVEPLRFF